MPDAYPDTIAEQAFWGWQGIPHPELGPAQIHVMPMSDCGSHAFDRMCACSPFDDPEDTRMVIHHAWDGREAYEHGWRKMH